MDSDDQQVGRVLSRRRALAVIGAVGAGVTSLGVAAASAATLQGSDSASGAAPSPTHTSGPMTIDCVAKPEMTEGPYFIDELLNRSDIRADTATGVRSTGTELNLALRVLQLGSGNCTPLPKAIVDIWHCDAIGGYSDITSEGTAGKNYLRGYQVSDRAGLVRFRTILPGWYRGRTVHIHLKIRTTGTDGNPYEFTSQLFFPEDLKAIYLATAPYSAKGTPDTTNATDMIYTTVGDQMLLHPRRDRRHHSYSATFGIGLDLSDTVVGAPDAPPSGPPGGPPGGPPPTDAPTPTPTATS